MSGLDRLGRVNAVNAPAVASAAGLGGEVLGASAARNLRLLQDAVINGRARVFSPGTYPIDEPVLLGSNARIELGSDVKIRCTGVRRHPWLRMGNAEFVGSDSVNNVFVFCADESAGALRKTSYGTLEYATAPARLRWTAPGDTPGSYIDVSSASATNGWFTLPSGSAGRALHVVIGGGSFAGSALSRAVRIEPVTGARSMTWSRVSNVVTVTESGHTKRRGDFVVVFFGSSMWQGYVRSVTGDSWDFNQSAADGAGSGSSFSVRNVDILCAGAEVDFNSAALPGAVDGKNNHGMLLFGINDLHVEPPNYTSVVKYGTYITGCSGFKVLGARMLSSLSDCIHVIGPARNWEIDDVIAEGGDNIVGVGCTDYLTYNMFWPSNGTVDVENYRISNIEGRDTTYEMVRLYVANSGWLRDGKISNIKGTVDAATSSLVSVITDNNALTVDSGSTNIDGLEIDGVDGVRSAGTDDLRLVVLQGTGVRRRISIRGVPWRPNGPTNPGSVRIDCPIEDLTINVSHGNWDVCGDYLNLGGNAVLKRLNIEEVAVTRARSQALSGTEYRPVVVHLSGTTSQVESMTIGGGVAIDTSTTGTSKLCLIQNRGKKMNLTVQGLRVTTTDPVNRRADSLYRGVSTAENGSIFTFCGVHADVDYGVVCDGGVPAQINLAGYRQAYGAFIHGAAAAASNVTIQGSAVTVTSLLSVTLTNINVDVRDGLSCDGTRVSGPTDGALIRNTNASFQTGTGLYYRAGATWMKVA